MQRSDSLEKTLTLGKTEGRKRRGREDKMVEWDHSSMDMSVSRLGERVKDREARHAAVYWVTKSWTRLSDWTTRYTVIFLLQYTQRIIFYTCIIYVNYTAIKIYNPGIKVWIRCLRMCMMTFIWWLKSKYKKKLPYDIKPKHLSLAFLLTFSFSLELCFIWIAKIWKQVIHFL